MHKFSVIIRQCDVSSPRLFNLSFLLHQCLLNTDWVCLVGGHRKNSQPSETNKIRLGGWGFLKKSHFRFQMVFWIQIGLSLKCELLFVSKGRRGFQVKLILFVSLGFCELLRWPLTCMCWQWPWPTNLQSAQNIVVTAVHLCVGHCRHQSRYHVLCCDLDQMLIGSWKTK